jgi:hypothetical protein
MNLDRKIVCAAMQHPTLRTIVCSPRHMDGPCRSVFRAIHSDENDSKWVQGFVNTWGEFLTREEAWVVACHNKQIFRYVGNQTEADFGVQGTKLYSENLY